MEWFVQTPEHSFKSTFFDRIPLVVFSPGACLSEYTAWLQDPFSCGVVHLWSLRRTKLKVDQVTPVRGSVAWMAFAWAALIALISLDA